MDDKAADTGPIVRVDDPASSGSTPTPERRSPTPPDNRRHSQLARGAPVIRRRARSVLEAGPDAEPTHRRMQSAPSWSTDTKGKKRGGAPPPPYDAAPAYSAQLRTGDKKHPALDLLAFPQLTTLVLRYTAGSTYPALRATCKTLRARIDEKMYAHVEVKIAVVPPEPRPAAASGSRLSVILRTLQATGAFLGVSALPFIPEGPAPAARQAAPAALAEDGPPPPTLAVSIVAPALGHEHGLPAGSRIPGLQWDMRNTAVHARTVKRLRAHTRVVDDGGSLSFHLDGLGRDEAAMLRLAFGSARVVRNSAGTSVLSAPTHVLFRALDDGVYLPRHVPERCGRVIVHLTAMPGFDANLSGVLLPGPGVSGQRKVYAVFTGAWGGSRVPLEPPGILRDTVKDALRHEPGAVRYTLVGLADLNPALFGVSWSAHASTDARHEILRNRVVEYALRVGVFSRAGGVTREQVLAMFELATPEQFRKEVGDELPVLDHPSPVIDHLSFPHIFNRILDNAPLAFFHGLRATNWEMYHRANAVLYEHVCVSATGDVPAKISISSPYDKRRIPGLKWDPKDPTAHALTLLRLQAYTRTLDDLGRTFTFSYATTHEICTLLGALGRVQSVRAPSMLFKPRPYLSFAQTVNPPPGQPSQWEYNPNFYDRAALTRTMVGEHLWDGKGSLPLLPATTSFTWKQLYANTPIIHPHGHLPSVTTVVIGVVFSDVRESITNVVIVFHVQPKDASWTDEGPGPSQHLGVLHTIMWQVQSMSSCIRSVTLVGLEEMDPVYYRLDPLTLSTPWGERKEALLAALEAAKPLHETDSSGLATGQPYTQELYGAAGKSVQKEALTTLRLSHQAANSAWPAQRHPFIEPVPGEGRGKRQLPASTLSTRLAGWRLLTFAEWRREVGDEAYALAMVPPWRRWPPRCCRIRPERA
ncbi:hypothetical protein Q8F55_009256 [Vanrija albida]|uniref:F-box domain-containing protein n=1 Tax=Vanrija albida TaxID=181172 RepID=A0ABR3PTE0_9TREE